MALAPFFWCGAYFPTLVKNPAVKIDQVEIDDFKWATYEEALVIISFKSPKKI